MPVTAWFDHLARLAATSIASRRRTGPQRRPITPAEPLEQRTLLSTTVTLTGTAGNDAFLATVSGTTVAFYVNGGTSAGVSQATVPIADLAGLTIVGNGGADTLNVYAPGTAFTLDVSAASGLALSADGGTVRLASATPLASAEIGTAGTLDLTAPTTLAGPLALAGTLQVDNGGDGSATTTLGDAAHASGPAATVDVTAGTLAASSGFSGVADGTLSLVGPGTVSAPDWRVDGTVVQSAGTVAVDALDVAHDWGTATYDLTGGTLDAGTLTVGSFSYGHLAQSGGTLTAGHTEVGTLTAGTIAQTGGTATYGDVFLGYYFGHGTLDLSGGTTAAADVYLSQYVGATGELDLSGTARLNVPGAENVSNGGVGTISQTGGSNACGILVVGNYNTHGTYDLSGGTLWAGQEIVGYDATLTGGLPSVGSFTQTGGTNTVGPNGLWLGVGDGGVGTYTLAAGTLSDPGFLFVGVQGSTAGTYAQTGGSATVALPLLGYLGTAAASVTGGTLAVTGNAYVGYAGPATLDVSGTAAVTVANALYVGGDGVATDPAAGPAALTLSGSAHLTTQQTYVGYSGPAAFAQTGGTHTTQTLILNDAAARHAAYHVAAGTVAAATAVDLYAPSADGPGVVDEGSAYTLGLFGNGDVTAWQVGWGDGASSNIAGDPPSAAHTYTAGGNTYTVTPTAYAGSTPHPAAAVPVLVNDLPAAVTAPATLANSVGQATAISATFADPGTSQTHTALVNWGDGTATAATVTESNGSGTVTATHRYALHGAYAATLMVTDSGGAVATVPFAVAVAYVAPAVSASTDDAGVTPGQPATLTLHDGGPEAASAVTAWSVNWGDGTAPQAVTTPPDAAGPADATWAVTHAYAAAGSYAAVATATDSAGGHAAAPVAFTVAVPTPAPTDLTATALDDQDVQLTWTPNPSDPNTRFEVSRQNADGSWTTLGTVDDTADGDAYDDAGLSGGTAYAYRVRSVGATAADDSAYTGPVAVTTPLTTPDAPTDVSATESIPGEVDLTWAESSPFVTGYVVTATPAGGGAATTFAVAGDAQAVAATGLTAGVAYSFAVTADNDQGNGHDVRSAASDAVSAVPSLAALTATAPATANEGASFDLALASSLPGGGPSPIVSWHVAWDDGSAADTLAAATGTDAHTPAVGAGAVIATVTATDGAGRTFTLPAVNVVVVPAAPTAVTAVAQTEHDVLVSWQNVTLTAAPVVVSRSDDGGQTYAALATVDAAATHYDDAGLTGGTAYKYQVQSQASDGLSVSAPASPPAGPTTTPSGSVSLSAAAGPSWDGVALTWAYGGGDAAGFELEMEDASVAGRNFALYGTPGPVDAGGHGSAVVGGLVAGDVYKFRVRADKADGTVSGYAGTQWTVELAGAGAAAATVVGVPDGYVPWLQLSVSGLRAAGGVEIEVRGDAYAGDAWHQLNYGQDAAWPLANPDQHGSELTLDDPGVTISAGKYEYRVRGFAAGGRPTDWSDPTSATFPNTAAGPKLSFSAGSDRIAVSWQGPGTLMVDQDGGYGYPTYFADVQDARFGYYVEHGTYDPATDTTTETPTGLVPGTKYDFALVSGPSGPDPDGSDVPAFVTRDSATTTGTAPTDAATPAAPGAAFALVDPRNGNEVDLHWLNTPDNETGYKVYRSIGGGGFEEIGETGPDVTTYADPLPGTVSPGLPRQYQVRSLAAHGATSGPATTQAVAQPYAPTYTLGKAPDGVFHILTQTGGRYYWHRVLHVKDKNGGVIIQKVTIVLAGPQGQSLTKTYWEAIQVPAGQDQVDDTFKNTHDFGPFAAKVTQTGDAIYYPDGSVPTGLVPNGVGEAGGLPSSLIDPKLPQVPPLHQIITWTLQGGVPTAVIS